jgi:formylmethanofuran:tetrahydromethanopterin formyltransferase
MVDAIGEGYWEVPVPGTSPQIGVTLGVGVELPVKAATVYYGVPDGLEVDALEAATRQLIEGPTAIEGVYVLEICGPTEA